MENIINIDYHITDYCNLKCISCGHFCPLVPKSEAKGKDLDTIKKDLTLLKEVVGDRLDNLNITGGECLTHPQFREVLEIAISLFAPKITIYTNGLLYRKLDTVEDLIKDSGIMIKMSDYAQDWYEKAVDHLSDKFGSQFEWISRRGEDGIVWWIHQFFSSRDDIPDEAIMSCEAREQCLQLVGNRLYVCQYAAYFHYFNDYFEGLHNLKLGDDEGYIDIAKRPSVEEILEFMRTVKFDLCKHCIDCTRNYDLIPWDRSGKQLDEWFRDER